jgi:hypothetical protein
MTVGRVRPTHGESRKWGEPQQLVCDPPSPTSSRALVRFFGVRAEQAPPPVSQHTVGDVPGDITFTDHRQIGVLQHRLGRIGAAALAAEPAPVNRPELTLVHARVEQPLRFPCGRRLVGAHPTRGVRRCAS